MLYGYNKKNRKYNKNNDKMREYLLFYFKFEMSISYINEFISLAQKLINQINIKGGLIKLFDCKYKYNYL